MAGQNRVGDINQYAISARTDLWNKTALPIATVPQADGILNQTNTVTIANGAWVGSAGDVNLLTEMGEISVIGKGVGKDLYREALETVVNAVGGNASLEINGGNGGVQGGSADVVVAGTVQTGINNTAVLLIGDTAGSLPDSGIAGFDTNSLTIDSSHAGVAIAATEGVDYTIEQGSDLLAALNLRIAQITKIRDSYAGTNEYDDFNNQLTILLSLRNDLAPGSTAVNFINVKPIYASSGNIVVKGHSLTGSGTGRLIAPSDTSVVIRNATDYYLRTEDITIPEYGGGYITFNFRELGASDQGSYGLTEIASIANNAAFPSITIESTVGDPSIEINGDISNLNGTVNVSTEGNIYLWASVEQPDRRHRRQRRHRQLLRRQGFCPVEHAGAAEYRRSTERQPERQGTVR